MAFVAAIGAAVVGAFGATASVAVAGVVGGAIVGAAVGALYSAVTDGDILKGALFGAIGGAVTGGLGASLNMTGGAAVSEGMSTAASTAGESAYVAAADTALGIGNTAVDTAATGGLMGATGATNAATMSASDMFFKSAANSAGNNIFSLGAAFLNAGAGDSRTEEYARQFDENRKNELADRKSFSDSVKLAGDYAAGQAQSATLSEINRQRLELPAPMWATGKQQQQTAATNQINPNSATVSMNNSAAAGAVQPKNTGLLAQPKVGATA